MKISQLATAAGVGVETVRYYQRIGLLSTPVRSGGFREYQSVDLARLQFIRRAKALGFTIDEISTLVRLSASNCEDVERISHERLTSVREKVADLERIANVLNDVVTRCEARQPHQGCPIIEALVAG